MRNILHDVFIVIGGVILFCCAQALLYFVIFVKLGANIDAANFRLANSAIGILGLTNFFSHYYCGKLVKRFLTQPHFFPLYSSSTLILTIVFIWDISSLTGHPISRFALCLGMVLIGFVFTILPDSVLDTLDKKNREKDRIRKARYPFDEK